MEIRTQLKRGYILRQGIIGLVCVILGLWGIYDYVWTIPQQQEAHTRYQVCLAVTDALDPELSADLYEEKKAAALEAVRNELQTVTSNIDVSEDDESVAPATESEALQQQVDRLKDAIQQLDARGDLQWFQSLILFRQAINTPREPATGQQAKLSGIHAAAWEVATRGVNEFAEVTPPAAYDRIMKGLIFIPCLPFGLYMLVVLALQKRKHYRLDEQGNLHLPSGDTWKRDEIADIDMSKWMSKSIARPKHTDGRIVKLDDYIHQDMHLVVGGLAHRFYPDQWQEDARKVKDESEEAANDADEPGEPEPAGVADADDAGDGENQRM